MSRYVKITTQATSLDQVTAALTAMGIAFERRDTGVMLQGSLECVGEPVAVRIEPGVADAVEDFGFALDRGVVTLVCGDVDRDVLTEQVLQPLTQRLAETSVRAAVASMPDVVLVRTDDRD